MIAPPVSVVINDRLVLSSRAPAIVAGAVMVPIDPFLLRLPGAVMIAPDGNEVRISIRGEAIVVNVGRRAVQIGARSIPVTAAPYAAFGATYVPLAPIVRALGGTATFAGRTKTLDVFLSGPVPLVTMTPYDPSAPRVAPTTLFSPVPTTTPRPVLTSIPRPRRTPVPAIPSRP